MSKKVKVLAAIAPILAVLAAVLLAAVLILAVENSKKSGDCILSIKKFHVRVCVL